MLKAPYFFFFFWLRVHVQLVYNKFDCFIISMETEASLLALAKSIYYFKALIRTETGLTEQKKEHKKKSAAHGKVIYCSFDLCRAGG